MSARQFIDTNVFVYCFDDTAPDKQTKARQIVRHAGVTGDGVVSYQVVQEFLNVATRKFAQPMTASDASRYLGRVLMPLCRAFPSEDLYLQALTLSERHQFSFYDGLIVAAALELGCAQLLSEDMHHGLTIGCLTITNPFAG